MFAHWKIIQCLNIDIEFDFEKPPGGTEKLKYWIELLIKLLEVKNMKGLFILIIIVSVSISSCIYWQSKITYKVAFI